MADTIFITGASLGIGKATARLFARRVWKVVTAMRNPEDDVELAGNNVPVTRLDLLDTKSIAAAVSEEQDRFSLRVVI